MEEEDGYVIRIRGLPWSASHEEIISFLEGVNIVGGKSGVHFTYVRDGRPSGEAYIELESQNDLEKAVAKDKHHMGKRYIDVFQSKRSEMDWVVKRSGRQAQTMGAEAVIRLRGLPFGCSKEEIAHFFTGLEIVPNGITLLQDAQGRTTGDAFVQFATPDIAENALEKHKERIGHRYIEIFKSSSMEVRNALNMMNRMMGMNRMGGMGGRPGPYDRSDRFGGGGAMGGGGGNMGFRGRGRGNIKGFFDDGFDDFGGGYGMTRGANMRSGGGMGMGGMGRMKGNGFGFGNRPGGGANYSDLYESQTGHCVHMRGLPFAATEQDILEFFSPLNPVNVFIHIQNDGRASGEADVDFATHEEAKEAMTKDKATMQHRYIELFMKSTPAGSFGADDGMGSGMGGGMGSRMGSGMADGQGGMGMMGMNDMTDFSQDDDFSGGMGNMGMGNAGMMNRGMNRMGNMSKMGGGSGMSNIGPGNMAASSYGSAGNMGGSNMGGGMGANMGASSMAGSMGNTMSAGMGSGYGGGMGPASYNANQATGTYSNGASNRGNNFGGGYGNMGAMGGMTNPNYTAF